MLLTAASEAQTVAVSCSHFQEHGVYEFSKCGVSTPIRARGKGRDEEGRGT